MRSSAKTGKGAKSRYFSDGLGSIRELTDQVGTVQHSYTYGARGELRAQNITVPNSYGYTGREFAEEGLYFYRARYLDPSLGRFIAEDPIGLNGGLNLYFYVRNSPANFIDPGGDCKSGKCFDCPNGIWLGGWTSFGGVLGIWGKISGFGAFACTSSSAFANLMYRCTFLGLGIGGAITGDPMMIWGAECIEDLTGISKTIVVSTPIGNIGSAGYGFGRKALNLSAGLGLGGWIGYLKCKFELLSSGEF